MDTYEQENPMDASTPDRPIAGWLRPLRNLIRRYRIVKHRWFSHGSITTGSNVNFARHVELRPPDYARFGNNVYIGPWFVAETNLDIGSDVLISGRVSCVGNDHRFEDPNRSIIEAGRLKPSTVIIEGDNLIGFGTIIIGDVRIGKGCIVGAGSVVAHDLPADTICAGVPAKPIRERYRGKRS